VSTQFRPTAGGPRITGLLNMALNRAIGHVNGEVAAQHPELRPAHLQLFRTGSLQGLRVTELAARTGMTKQAMHELVRHLEKHDYLHRTVDPDDERARRIELTDRGSALEKDVAAASARLHLRWQDQLGDELFRALWTALGELTGQAGEPPSRADLERRAQA
jgi:DNA-binding MarR family transcriptional regulator